MAPPVFFKPVHHNPSPLEQLLSKLQCAPPRTSNQPPLRHAPVRCSQIVIRSVWEHNLEEEFALLREAAVYYRYITIDTEFPAVTHTSTKHYRKQTVDDRYSLLKANVADHDITQLGVTLSDVTSRLPRGYVWEFNFRDFDITSERHNPASRALLQRQMIDLEKFRPRAIDFSKLAKLLMSSGIVCNPRMSWVAFGSAYDFGFLAKVLLGGQALPDTFQGFARVVQFFFGARVFDTKYLMRFCGMGDRLGLEQLAGKLGVQRLAGRAHQAGSDSLLTCQVFHKMKRRLQVGWEQQHGGMICGLQVI